MYYNDSQGLSVSSKCFDLSLENIIILANIDVMFNRIQQVL